MHFNYNIIQDEALNVSHPVRMTVTTHAIPDTAGTRMRVRFGVRVWVCMWMRVRSDITRR